MLFKERHEINALISTADNVLYGGSVLYVDKFNYVSEKEGREYAVAQEGEQIIARQEREAEGDSGWHDAVTEMGGQIIARQQREDMDPEDRLAAEREERVHVAIGASGAGDDSDGESDKEAFEHHVASLEARVGSNRLKRKSVVTVILDGDYESAIIPGLKANDYIQMTDMLDVVHRILDIIIKLIEVPTATLIEMFNKLRVQLDTDLMVMEAELNRDEDDYNQQQKARAEAEKDTVRRRVRAEIEAVKHETDAQWRKQSGASSLPKAGVFGAGAAKKARLADQYDSDDLDDNPGAVPHRSYPVGC